MYNRNSHQDLINAALTAAVSAGIVTSFAVSQGQHPLVAIAITGIATGFAVLCRVAGIA
ncbi:MAG: hypothetical protein SAJ12_21795 [Jaaginema sp. PMC 1079.18]|nr:hypothetical protein [Jaaginema sp. PMC 1080.18]MEC4853623.1 hypothetical protein [Jaaginema sp. PMC 1079.18]MEC4866952.1 hypothetical protein [Jaaginema sp. PMC 1078.18]